MSRLPRLLVCARCQVAAALRFAAGRRCPSSAAPAAPRASWPGAGARHGEAGKGRPVNPTPAAQPPGRLPGPCSPRRTRRLAACTRAGPRPSGGGRAQESSFCLEQDANRPLPLFNSRIREHFKVLFPSTEELEMCGYKKGTTYVYSEAHCSWFSVCHDGTFSLMLSVLVI